MARRSGARRSDSVGAVGAGARPAFASFSTARKRSTSAASEAAPITIAPRNGALHRAELEVGETLSRFVVAIDVGIGSLTFDGISVTATERLPFPFSR